jgi:peptide deformylase
MIREIVHYDAPVLRAKGRPAGPITPAVRKLVADLLDSMRAVRGVGLAAQQIGEAIQIAVIDVTGAKERPSKMWIDGKPVIPEEHMPVILIDPVLKPTKTKNIDAEGCLSFPGLTLEIPRAQRVSVRTRTLDGGIFEFDAAGWCCMKPIT